MSLVAPISLSPRTSAKPAGDRECRDLLKRHLVASLIDIDTVVLDELGLCQGDVRIDVAAVGGELSGFEIKSPADTLTRWPKQCRFYSKVVDRAWLVATEKSVEKAEAPDGGASLGLSRRRTSWACASSGRRNRIRNRTRIRSRGCCGATKPSRRSTTSASRAACAANGAPRRGAVLRTKPRSITCARRSAPR